jgi:hypothetical protein
MFSCTHYKSVSFACYIIFLQKLQTITTDRREHLGQLLASAMISRYFLHNAEQRGEFEQPIQIAREACISLVSSLGMSI